MRAAAAGLCLAVLPAELASAAPSGSLTVTIIPRDGWPPAPVTDLTGLPGGEGQLLLQWTAPDSNNNQTGSSTTAAGYALRIATFSVASIGGSTTAWWSQAKDVRTLAPPAAPASPPVPSFPGTSESLLLTGLEPGTTVYAALVSSDTIGNVSDIDVLALSGPQDPTLIYDAVPAAPTAATAAASGTSSIVVSWTATTAYDVWTYNVYVDSTAPNDFADGYVLSVASTSTSLTMVGLSASTYTIRVTAVDKGAPTYPGTPLESAFTPTLTVFLVPVARLAQAPFGIALTTGAGTATLSWMPVTRFFDGVDFSTPAAPSTIELSGYQVFRSSSLVLGGWTSQATVSTATLQWIDLASGSSYYYYVAAQNPSGLSERSVVRAAGSQSAYALVPDEHSYLEIRVANISPIEGSGGVPMTAYLVESSSRAQDLGGRVVKSVEFTAKQGGTILAPNFAIAGMGRLKLRYELGAGGGVVAAGAGLGVPATPANLGVYWFNGSAWVQMYGTLDPLDQTLNLETKYFGRYQLRTVERTGGFAFDQAGVSNRFVTPNGDGKNDAVVFTFDNPRDSSVSIRILDRRGVVIASDLVQGPISNSRVWTPGAAIPGGVYIYMITAEGHTYTGTIVLLK
ncbi:MAG: gliding motility-associated C-terminal domain-containing protein [Elusimicrobia bacterium]|nr:gliding motility-associated C-terminal domain-containing protein [Elusimicrobiota bacterium]